MNKDEVARAWVAGVLESTRVREVRSLTFGIISDVRLLEADGELVVLRRYTADWIQGDAPSLVDREARALAKARTRLEDLVPRPLAADADGHDAGWPALLTSYLPGSAVIHEINTRRAAAVLTKLHTGRPPSEFAEAGTGLDRREPRVPAWTRAPGAWTAVSELSSVFAPPSPSVFLHRDYHPGNMLWDGAALSGIVDWSGASVGPAAIDVAHMRINLALVDGPSRADEFLDAYIELNPDYHHHPSWDAAELLGFADDFSGVLAFKAFGAKVTLAELRARADLWAAALAGAETRSSRTARK